MPESRQRLRTDTFTRYLKIAASSAPNLMNLPATGKKFLENAFSLGVGANWALEPQGVAPAPLTSDWSESLHSGGAIRSTPPIGGETK